LSSRAVGSYGVVQSYCFEVDTVDAFISTFFSLDGTISVGTYWLFWVVMVVLTSWMLHALTGGWVWQDGYGADGASARNLAIAIAIVAALTIYPEYVITTKAIKAADISSLWLIPVFLPIVVQPVTQWAGLNGSMAKPTPLGWLLSLSCIFGVVGIGLKLHGIL
jgi:uncharacterized membrane protein YhaH (DUF805 family)